MQMAPNGPVPELISFRHVAVPGPNVSQIANSEAQAPLHGRAGAGGGDSGRVHPVEHTEPSGPVPRLSSSRQPDRPGP